MSVERHARKEINQQEFLEKLRFSLNLICINCSTELENRDSHFVSIRVKLFYEISYIFRKNRDSRLKLFFKINRKFV